MQSGFLSKLKLDKNELEKLEGLAAADPVSLLSIRQAAPEAFENLLGKVRADEITEQLKGLLTPEERRRLDTGAPRRFPLGARLGDPPGVLPAPKFDISQRDRVFQELQVLRRLSSPSPSTRKRIADLEQQLNVLLESK